MHKAFPESGSGTQMSYPYHTLQICHSGSYYQSMMNCGSCMMTTTMKTATDAMLFSLLLIGFLNIIKTLSVTRAYLQQFLTCNVNFLIKLDEIKERIFFYCRHQIHTAWFSFLFYFKLNCYKELGGTAKKKHLCLIEDAFCQQ